VINAVEVGGTVLFTAETLHVVWKLVTSIKVRTWGTGQLWPKGEKALRKLLNGMLHNLLYLVPYIWVICIEGEVFRACGKYGQEEKCVHGFSKKTCEKERTCKL
jgi:uncharacterized protein YqhQ